MAYEPDPLQQEGGVYPPGALGAKPIIDRLAKHGITFATTREPTA